MSLLPQVRLTAVVLAVGLLTALTSTAQAVQSGLHLSLSREQKSIRPLFRVELSNTGEQPLILKLGVMWANGRQQHLNAIHLLLTEAHGKTLRLDLLKGGIVPGRTDPLIVPLPAGASFAFWVDLGNYMSAKENVWELKLAPGRYKLSAEYVGAAVSPKAANLDMQGLALMPYWIGTLASNTLSFTLTQKMGGQHGQ